jgi:hypothetical protein
MSNKKKENNQSIHTGTRKKTNRKPLLEGPAARKILWIVNLVALAVLVLIIAFALSIRIGTAKPLPQETTAPTEMEQPEEPTEAPMNLNYGLTITDVGSYTGVYMEDGSDDIVSGVLMIEVTNTGEENVEYAEIHMACGEETAYFKLSTLPAGETVILLELNRMQYAADAEYSVAVVENVAIFRHELSVCEDKIQLQVLDGTMNVKNISGEDIDGDVIVYYKNYSSGIYYGGITYMIRIQGGMEADEVRQSAATHISPSGSRVMFVTCGA